MPAAVGVIGSGPLDDGFLAIEEEQLDRQRIRAGAEHASQFEQERRARSPVVGANEPDLAEKLRIVVAGNDEPLRARALNGGRQVDHAQRPERRRGVEGLLDGANTECGELIGDVPAGVGQACRPGRSRSNRHQLPDVLVGAAAVESRLGLDLRNGRRQA